VRLDVHGVDQKPAALAVGFEVEPRHKPAAEEEGQDIIAVPPFARWRADAAGGRRGAESRAGPDRASGTPGSHSVPSVTKGHQRLVIGRGLARVFLSANSRLTSRSRSIVSVHANAFFCAQRQAQRSRTIGFRLPW
jgi:hypothetical protein